MRVEWRAALDQFRTEVSGQPAAVSTFSFAIQQRFAASDPRAMPGLVQLNAITSEVFTGISRSPIPVLLPFDTAAWVEARQNGATENANVARYQADFRPVDVFHAGLSGYDATFSLAPGAGEGLPSRTFARPVEVQITGSLLVYDLADPAGGKGEPVKSLSAQFPDMRRFIREGYVRYAFTKFGVPYVVSIQCLDSAPRARRLACREAYPVAERFLKALRVVGGLPSRQRMDIASISTERPAATSDFTYRPSGDIIAKTGSRRQSGHPDNTAYSQIRFPLVRVPVAIRSQQFARRDKTTLVGGTYPWRDNFCEDRSFNVGQCASGFGHQGQDIRPRPCAAEEGANGCDDKRQAIVAVRDAVVIRAPKQQAATLQVNTRTEHIRFRYMHMNPSAMDADGLLNGRRVDEGEPIGMVSNYLDRPGGTSRHLHFDVQVFTRDGWLWVNPYTTLISAYERLIRGRGREIGTDPVTASAVAHAMPVDAIRLDPHEGGQN